MIRNVMLVALLVCVRTGGGEKAPSDFQSNHI